VLEEKNITHILSVIKYSLTEVKDIKDGYVHMSVDVDDVEDEDILVHLPGAVRFIERGLYGDAAFTAEQGKHDDDGDSDDDDDSITPAPPGTESATAARPGPGAVYVHCAMGKSRSVTAVVAWLLWKYPHRFAGSSAGRGRGKGGEEEALAAVGRAIAWVRRSRSLVEPNPGFVRQLALWWEMGCPAEGGDDAVARNRMYRRWAYKREVEESARIGRAPDRLRFEDEVGDEEVVSEGARVDALGKQGLELRCKKCRRVLATEPFVVPHQRGGAGESSAASTAAPSDPCQHFFVEPLSWMRPVLEQGVLDGRLLCPNDRCGASIGRYSWQGFKCNCREWVCPAFSLQRNRVDDVVISARPAVGGGGGIQDAEIDRMAAMGIRLPPGARAATKRENL